GRRGARGRRARGALCGAGGRRRPCLRGLHGGARKGARETPGRRTPPCRIRVTSGCVSEEEVAVYEPFWDCKYCGQEKLLAITHRFCATCGAAQDPNAQYDPPEQDRVSIADHIFVGADIACPACGQAMSADAACCTSCGSPLRGEVVEPEPPPMTAAPLVS